MLLPIAAIVLAVVAASDDPLTEHVNAWGARLEQAGTPGVSVAVVKDDRVILEAAFGIRNADGDPADSDTVFYIASSTKSFTAFAICMLAAEGKLDLDQPVVEVLPAFRLKDEEATRSVTIRDLLSHRLGISAHPAIVFNDAYSGQITEERFFRLLERSEPTGKFTYNNLHFTILGRCVESVSGLHWKRFLRERIFDPIGMGRTSGNVSYYDGDPNVSFGLQPGIRGFEDVAVAKTDETMHAAGGLKTTARDLAQFIRLNLNRGIVDGTRLLPEKNTEAMWVRTSKDDGDFGPFQRSGYGLGWVTGALGGETLVSHFGGYAGFSAHVSFMPEHGVGVAVVANGGGSAGRGAHAIACDVYRSLCAPEAPYFWPELFEQAKAREAQPKAAGGEGMVESEGLMLDPEAYVGSYDNDDWGTFEIYMEAGELQGRIGNLSPRLICSSIDGFRCDLFPGAEVNGMFDIDDASERATAIVITIQGEPNRFVRRELP